MPKPTKLNLTYRIIDANVNRAKEGLRVCEEITRFIILNRTLTEGLKKIRHSLDSALKNMPAGASLIKLRDSLADVGFGIKLKKEFQRQSYRDIFYANIARVKESIRVLEEFSKLENIKAAAQFKRIRYRVYDIEKKIVKEISALRYHR